MTPQLAAERIADLSNDFDLGRMVIFRVLQLIDSVLMVDRVGREMNQIGRILTKQTCAQQPSRSCICPKLAETAIISSQVEFADVAALRRRAQELVAILLRFGWGAAGKGKLRIGK